MDSDTKIEMLQALRLQYVGGQDPDDPESVISPCQRCDLCRPRARQRTHVVFGGPNVDADVMIIGEAPRGKEDRYNGLFWEDTPVGAMVDNFLKSMNVTRDDVWFDSMVSCRATEAGDASRDRPPNKDELAACRERLYEVIRIVDPKVVILLGKAALKLAKKWGDYEDKELVPCKTGITSIAQEPDPLRLCVEIPGVLRPVRFSAFATFNPAYLLRLKDADLKRTNSDLEMAWRVWRHAFRMADSFNYVYEGTIPPQRGIDTE